MADIALHQLLLLIAGGFFAGLVDSIAGGGGIITLPLFLAAGLPPHLALGTNKLQASFGSLTAALRYRKGGLVSFRALLRESSTPLPGPPWEPSRFSVSPPIF